MLYGRSLKEHEKELHSEDSSTGAENPEILESGNQEIMKSGNHEIKKSGNHEIRKLGNQEIRKSGNQDIWKTGKAGNQEIKKSEKRNKYSDFVFRMVPRGEFFLIVSFDVAAQSSSPSFLLQEKPHWPP